MGTDGNSYAVLLWGYGAYHLMKKFCQKKSDDTQPTNEQTEPEAPDSVEGVRICLSYEGEKRNLGGSYRFDGKDFRTPLSEMALEQDIAPVTEQVDFENVQDDNVTQEDEKTERKSEVKWILFCTVFLLVLSIIYNIIQYVKIDDLVRESKFVSYPKDYYENYNKASFLDKNIVFVIEGYGDYYYTYDEMMREVESSNLKNYGGLETSEFWSALSPEKRMELLGKYNGEFSYWAFNKEQAIALGYKAAFRN